MADEETSRVSAKRAPIRIDCTLPGHEGEFVVFKADGWKFKHLRLWENAIDQQSLVDIVVERIEGWHLLDEAEAEIPFAPTIGETANPAALDELPPIMYSWLVQIFRQAYRTAGRPNPNA